MCMWSAVQHSGPCDLLTCALHLTGRFVCAPNLDAAVYYIVWWVCQGVIDCLFLYRGGHLGVVKYLLQLECSIDVKEVDNWTPLHWAAMYVTKITCILCMTVTMMCDCSRLRQSRL